MLTLFLLAASSAALYFVLATNSDAGTGTPFESSLSFWLPWVPLVVFYGLAARRAVAGERRGIVSFILVTSLLFRAVLLVGEGFDRSEALARSPIDATLERVVPSFEARRWVVTVGDLAALALAPGLLRSVGLHPGFALLHGWNPLAIKEAAGSGRSELLALLALVLSLRLARGGRPWAAAAAYGLTLTGPLYLLGSIPAMVRALGAKLSLAIAFAGAAWWAVHAERLGTLFALPNEFLGGSLAPALTTVFGLLLTRDPRWAAFVCLAGFGVVALVRAVRSGRNGPEPAELGALLGSLLFVCPRVLPPAFVCLAYLGPYLRNPGWLVFTATAPLTYLAMGRFEWGFFLGFGQYFLPYASLIYFWLGRPPRKAAGRRRR